MQPDDFGVVKLEYDLPGQPLKAKTLQQCIDACGAESCVAFSRKVGLLSSDVEECWLKSDGPGGDALTHGVATGLINPGTASEQEWTTYITVCPGPSFSSSPPDNSILPRYEGRSCGTAAASRSQRYPTFVHIDTLFVCTHAWAILSQSGE